MLPSPHEESSDQVSPMINVSQYLFVFAEACFRRSVQFNLTLSLFTSQYCYCCILPKAIKRLSSVHLSLSVRFVPSVCPNLSAGSMLLQHRTYLCCMVFNFSLDVYCIFKLIHQRAAPMWQACTCRRYTLQP